MSPAIHKVALSDYMYTLSYYPSILLFIYCDLFVLFHELVYAVYVLVLSCRSVVGLSRLPLCTAVLHAFS